MIALDTNMLVYAHRAGVKEHIPAMRAIERASQQNDGWGITLANLTEFWSIVTHSSCQGRPSTPAEATRFITSLVRSGNGAIWLPGHDFGTRLMQIAQDLGISGVRIFDLQIALTAFENGATRLWTHDRHFVSVPGLIVEDPL